MLSAKNSVSVHWCWVTAHLCEQLISIDVSVLTLNCSEPVLQISPERGRMLFAKNSVSVHWCWVTAHLYEEQIFIGVIALTLGCSEPVLHSSPEQ